MQEFLHPDFPMNQSMLKVIDKKDVLLHYPYHSFDHFIELLREAAIDPEVESIKITLYRLAPKSKVCNALINAVKNGKNVTVVMELQARFDEEHNIYWSDKLREEGAKVLLGVQGLKVHCKVCLITRREKGKRRHYANISTGNYNEITARLYADHSLFTADERITKDLIDLFNFLENNYKIVPFKHIVVAPFQLRRRIENLFDNEIAQAKKGKPAWIKIKLNNLADVDMTEKIVEAVNAGVKIEMIIRSTCSVLPGTTKFPENLRIISIVDKLLEHSRILIFCDKGKETTYITSADWMYRNLNTRVEMACPIYDERIKAELKHYFDIQFKDNVKARIINDTQDNQYQVLNADVPNRSQDTIHRYLYEKSLKEMTTH
jgi:polyphosphate kinase